mmetsp:Transcript_57890/g.131319  ORF Transcript_57890/g.131319 Transcript_57890/m.131319 type:complete len:234 (-) Transcript_57890:165-866(-)
MSSGRPSIKSNLGVTNPNPLSSTHRLITPSCVGSGSSPANPLLTWPPAPACAICEARIAAAAGDIPIADIPPMPPVANWACICMYCWYIIITCWYWAAWATVPAWGTGSWLFASSFLRVSSLVRAAAACAFCRASAISSGVRILGLGLGLGASTGATNVLSAGVVVVVVVVVAAGGSAKASKGSPESPGGGWSPVISSGGGIAPATSACTSPPPAAAACCWAMYAALCCIIMA